MDTTDLAGSWVVSSSVRARGTTDIGAAVATGVDTVADTGAGLDMAIAVV
jgi:hypothetical protein